jgi:hypothetical protein
VTSATEVWDQAVNADLELGEPGRAMCDINRDALFRQLRHSLVLLAADGSTALAGLPDGCCKPDELALDFDHARTCVVGNYGDELPQALTGALIEVDAAFRGMPRDCWSEEAVRSSPFWAIVRERARQALGLLDQFDW